VPDRAKPWARPALVNLTISHRTPEGEGVDMEKIPSMKRVINNAKGKVSTASVGTVPPLGGRE